MQFLSTLSSPLSISRILFQISKRISTSKQKRREKKRRKYKTQKSIIHLLIILKLYIHKHYLSSLSLSFHSPVSFNHPTRVPHQNFHTTTQPYNHTSSPPSLLQLLIQLRRTRLKLLPALNHINHPPSTTHQKSMSKEIVSINNQ